MILKNRQTSVKIPLRTIRKAVSTILKELAVPHSDLDITFVGDTSIRRLNRKFRGIDRPTDVLSFPLWEARQARKDGLFLGDVVISGPTTRRQAERLGKKPLEEILFLIVHGVLHLQGYDHEGSLRQARLMQGMEKKLMKRLCSLAGKTR